MVPDCSPVWTRRSQPGAGTEECDDDRGVKRYDERHRDDKPEFAGLVMEDDHSGQRSEGAGEGGQEKRSLGDPAQAQSGAPFVGRVQDENREVRGDAGDQGVQNQSDLNHLSL
jgi:hypothetical protein